MKENISLFDILKQAEGKPVDMAQLYGNVLVQKSISNRSPLSIQMELLPLCNFDCKVCYIKMTKDEVEKSGYQVLRFEDWKYYIDSAFTMGISSITFTGGECTIHPDFLRLYEYAYNKGFQVGMISNGSNITPEIIELFKKCPPSKIYITLYGMSEETYERFCANGSAYPKVMHNIELLRSMKINTILNYTVGKDNICDLEEALCYARDHEMSIFPNNALINYKKCDAKTLKEENADIYLYEKIEHEHLSKHYHMSFEEYENSYFGSVTVPIDEDDTKGLHCNAGRCMFTINWKGKMQPCASLDHIQLDPRTEGGMEQCWKKLVAWADEVPVLEDCRSCIFQKKCRRCVALHFGDTGEYGKVSPRFCFKELHPEEAAKLQAEYDQQKALEE